MREICTNRKAFRDYDIEERLEAGIVLTGTEIKSIREGKVDLKDSFARPKDGELWLYNMHISPYSHGNIYNHDPKRPRKLLLHKDEIISLTSKVNRKGYTLIPLRLYLNRKGIAKIELALCKGRKLHDKKELLIRKEVEREIGRALRRGYPGKF